MPETVEITCETRAKTKMARQIHDGKTTVWIPESQIEDEGDDSVFIPRWLAEEKGLV